MSASLKLVPAANSEWHAWITRCQHEFYHNAEYHLFSEESGEGRAFLAIVGNEEKFVAWPYLLRNIAQTENPTEHNYTDIGAVYGYPGPVYHNCSNDEAYLGRALNELRDLWLSQGAVAVFTRFNPLLENHLPMLRIESTPVAADTFVQQKAYGTGLRISGQTVSMDLLLSEFENSRSYQKVLRQEISRGRREGLKTVIDEGWRYLEEFVTLYHLTMEKNRALKNYFFSIEDLRRLKRALGSSARLMLTFCGANMAAAGIFIEYRGIVQAHLAGVNPDMIALSPLKVLLDDVRRWAKDRGNRVFHLGGGRSGRSDSLMAFKARFSARRHDFCTGRWVLDPSAYCWLASEHLRRAKEASQVIADDDYFPAYRAPLCSVERQAIGDTES
jgi:hypothetical protein